MPEPDLSGMAEAHQRLRDKLGWDIRFYAPIAGTYAPGTRLDPESGKPYDPTIQPIGSGWASGSVRCSVISRPFGLSRSGIEDQSKVNALGIMDAKTVGLVMATAQFTGVVADATEFEYLDRRFKIVDDMDDELGIRDRHLIVGEMK